MKHIAINGWVGKWDPEKKYVFSPITVSAPLDKIVLVDNARGTELTDFRQGHSPEKGVLPPKTVYDKEQHAFIDLAKYKTPTENQCYLKSRTIDRNGPRYCAIITDTRIEMDLEVGEFMRIKKYLEEN